ncbi:MAG: 2-amino-4-hydroxy-6-hydroxymethyldihydropteridine diphosphokinase [candidate division FCPU426 bacterium]
MDVYAGLGANLGNPRQQLRRAVASLRRQPGIQVLGVSSLYMSRPQGGGFQPDYLNAVAWLRTEWAARALLDLGQGLEAAAGRVLREKNAPRELDVDWLLYNGRVIREPGLELPHPRLSGRAFVLEPLSELAPGLLHPRLGLTMRQLASRLADRARLRRIQGPNWAWGSEE